MIELSVKQMEIDFDKINTKVFNNELDKKYLHFI